MVPFPLPAPHQAPLESCCIQPFQLPFKSLQNLFQILAKTFLLPVSLDKAVCEQVCTSLGADFVYCLNVSGADFLWFFLQGRQILIPSCEGRVKIVLLPGTSGENCHHDHVIQS